MKLKKLAMVLGIAGTMFVSAYASAVQYAMNVNYFSNPGKTMWVGTKHIACDGTVSMSGSVGPYQKGWILGSCGATP
jgi:hypothetical protein